MDKESTSYPDIFDAYRLALKYYQLQTRSVEDYNEEAIKKELEMPNITTKLGHFCAIHGYYHDEEYLECDFCNEHNCSVDMKYLGIWHDNSGL